MKINFLAYLAMGPILACGILILPRIKMLDEISAGLGLITPMIILSMVVSLALFYFDADLFRYRLLKLALMHGIQIGVLIYFLWLVSNYLRLW